MVRCSVRLAESGGRDAELVAVFGDRAACDVYAATAEFFGEGIVGERGGFGLGIDNVLERGLDGIPRNIFAGVGLCAAGEEGTEGDDAAGCEEVFLGDSAADGGDVDAELLGDEGHGEGLEALRAKVEVLALRGDNDVDDAEKCAAALLDGIEKPGGVGEVFLDELACLAR